MKKWFLKNILFIILAATFTVPMPYSSLAASDINQIVPSTRDILKSFNLNLPNLKNVGISTVTPSSPVSNSSFGISSLKQFLTSGWLSSLGSAGGLKSFIILIINIFIGVISAVSQILKAILGFLK